MNSIELTGRLVRDPERRNTTDGTSVCVIRLAVDGMGRGGRNETGYVNVVSFGKSAEAAVDTLSQGWLVAVAGRLQHETWQTQDGGKREGYSVVGHVEFLARPRAGEASEEAADAA